MIMISNKKFTGNLITIIVMEFTSNQIPGMSILTESGWGYWGSSLHSNIE